MPVVEFPKTCSSLGWASHPECEDLHEIWKIPQWDAAKVANVPTSLEMFI